MFTKEEMMSRMQENADENGYFLCPDAALLDELLDGLVKNEGRYGYAPCPCRISCGVKGLDADIICPCEYRDADVDEFGMCYCGLFVSKEVKDDPARLEPIPERRPIEVIDEVMKAKREGVKDVDAGSGASRSGSVPVWRCKVCGYLAARDIPPPVCPICKAKRDRFERFAFG